MITMSDYEFSILRSLRKIIRAVEQHSKDIQATCKVTVPQLLCLNAITSHPEQTMSRLAEEINLSASTVNGIVDRLEERGLIRRRRSNFDRRKVFLDLTDAGKELTRQVPPLLQEKFCRNLARLPELERVAITLALENIVRLMEAGDVDASANLLPGDPLHATMQELPQGATTP